MRLAIGCVLVWFVFVGQLAADDAECPWEFSTGHWQLTIGGYTANVVWRTNNDGQVVVGDWEDETGKFTELAGWRPDQKVLVSTSYGSNGSYCETKFTTVTKSMLKGDMIRRLADGRVMKGTWQVTKKGDDEKTVRFDGTIDGEEITIEGSFKRVKK